MFTGIIRHVGTIVSASPAGTGRRLVVDLGPLAAGLDEGESVAVSGVCLTAVGVSGAEAAFDVVAETLSRTTLGGLGPGSRVNLERSLRPDQGIDGHIVQGHVDATAAVRSVRRGREHLVEFSAGRELTGLMVPKGSAAIDGVSLTLVEVGESVFSVALVPATLERTTLVRLAEGDRVNVEADIIGKYVLKHLKHSALPAGTGLTVEKLRESGFV